MCSIWQLQTPQLDNYLACAWTASDHATSFLAGIHFGRLHALFFAAKPEAEWQRMRQVVYVDLHQPRQQRQGENPVHREK
jgi:hypothetical protein